MTGAVGPEHQHSKKTWGWATRLPMRGAGARTWRWVACCCPGAVGGEKKPHLLFTWAVATAASLVPHGNVGARLALGTTAVVMGPLKSPLPTTTANIASAAVWNPVFMDFDR